MLKTFAYHKPSESGLERIAALREAFSVLKIEMDAQCQSSREYSIAVTKLEEAAMWAVKAVVFNDPNSKIE